MNGSMNHFLYLLLIFYFENYVAAYSCGHGKPNPSNLVNLDYNFGIIFTGNIID